MADIRRIATRFTIDGVNAVRSTMSRIGSSVAEGARRAGTAIRDFSTGAVRRIGAVSRALAGVSFKALVAGSKAAFLGIGVAATGAATKIGLLSAAAKSATDDITEYLLRLRDLSMSNGQSVGDLATMEYASAMNQDDDGKLLDNLTKVSESFDDIREKIEKADESYRKTNGWTRQGLLAAIQTGDKSAAETIMQAAVKARSGSFEGIADRKAGIERDIWATSKGGDLWNKIRARGYEDWQIEPMMARRRMALVAEFRQLDAAKKQLEDSQGNAGKALRELKAAGLDMDAVLKGGKDTLYALSDALDKIPTKAKKLEVLGNLFGKENAEKQFKLLDGGRKKYDERQAELERFGAIPTDADTEQAAALDQSRTRRKAAQKGVKIAVTREVSPMLEQTNNQIAEFLARNRVTIARIVREAFAALQLILNDAMKLFEGRTDFESTLFKKGKKLVDWSKEVIQSIRELAIATLVEVNKVLMGQDSDWPWLNKARDAFLFLRELALDVFAVFSGEDAKRFTWLNDIRDGVQKFLASFKEAWGWFRSLMESIHAAIKPVLDFLGIDLLSAAIFVGMLKMSGILKLMIGSFTGLLGLAGRLPGAFGTALSGITQAAILAAGKIALLGGAFMAGWNIGEWIAEKIVKPFEEAEQKMQETVAATMKLRDNAHINKKMDGMNKEQRFRFARDYLKQENLQGIKSNQESYEEDLAFYNSGKFPDRIVPNRPGDVISDDAKVATVRRSRRWAEKGIGPVSSVIEWRINAGGESASLYGGPETKSFVEAISRKSRIGG